MAMTETIDTLQASRVQFATSQQVANEIARIDAGLGSELPDSAALAIAAGWQAPGGHGRTFASLCGFFAVDVTDLLDAIAHEYPHAKAIGTQVARELDLLATWALNHPSRTYPLPRNVTTP